MLEEISQVLIFPTLIWLPLFLIFMRSWAFLRLHLQLWLQRLWKPAIKHIYALHCCFQTQETVLWRRGGKGGSRHKCTNDNFAFHESLLILAMCLGDLYTAINSPGKPAVNESEHTEVWSDIKRLKSEVQSSHQMPVKAVWPKKNRVIFFNYWSSMYS